ncbi:lamin tail domain-containing protein [Oceanicoccus sp. KOV_DT_Chl]|uniref:lamin tail domain-containing protein n=1 Tax=Oceanicoccus sp. KOV_DT_Chl TaxID=1904639 RepID=UPI000C7A4456|nr:lamin tail domain-containing protein [Oceanicoccus sp. KOV_DT_Chl]
MLNSVISHTRLTPFHNRILYTALFAISSQYTAAAVLPGDLLITEVMANPAAVSDANGEWFEVWNTRNHSIDLNGLTVRDEGSNNFTVDEPLLVAAGAFFVFAKNGDSASNGGLNADYSYSNFTLANSSDAIIIEFAGNLIDNLSYNDSALFGAAGNSAERIGGAFMLTPFEFSYGDGDIGTPGSAGSDIPVSTVPLPSAAWLMASALAGLIFRRKPLASSN